MKKLLILLGLTVGLYSDMTPYAGLGVSMSDADDTKVSCRASYIPIVGMEFSSSNDTTYSIEGRFSNGMDGSYKSSMFLFKPKYHGFYPLVGIGTTEYVDFDESLIGLRYGAGWDFGEKYNNIFVDFVYDEPMADYVISAGILYKFRGFN